MRNVIAVVLMSLAMASTAQALTFKKGEVLGSDGKTYSGASPEQMEQLIERAQRKTCQLASPETTFLLLLATKVSFVPSELRGATKDTQTSNHW